MAPLLPGCPEGWPCLHTVSQGHHGTDSRAAPQRSLAALGSPGAHTASLGGWNQSFGDSSNSFLPHLELWIHGGCGKREDQIRLELGNVLRLEKLTPECAGDRWGRAEVAVELSQVPYNAVTLTFQKYMLEHSRDPLLPGSEQQQLRGWFNAQGWFESLQSCPSPWLLQEC